MFTMPVTLTSCRICSVKFWQKRVVSIVLMVKLVWITIGRIRAIKMHACKLSPILDIRHPTFGMTLETCLVPPQGLSLV